MRRFCILLGAASAVALAARPAADPVGDFYQGKQIRVVMGAAPGVNYDLYSQLLARQIVRFIPGRLSVFPVNMPGAAGSPRSITSPTCIRVTAPCSPW